MTATLLELAPQLMQHPIEWLVDGDTFVIRGHVASYYQKQLAQIVARRLPGIQRVVNELEVRPSAICHGTGSHDRH
ncbi:MAG: BON domain-containing protein [Planctomycetaceae bacterium]